MRKRLVVPEPKQVVGSLDVLAMIRLYVDLVKQLFSVLITFIRRYTNNSYSIGLYINMNRVIKAEIDLNESIKGLKQTIRLVAFLKLQNIGMVHVVGNYWVRKARTNLSYKHKKEEMIKFGMPVSMVS